MIWKSEKDKKAHYASIGDEWDQKVIDTAEELGSWLEDGQTYSEFPLDPTIHPDQIGLLFGIMISEWEGDFWSLLSSFEKRIAAFYIGFQLETQAEWAFSQNHKGEADESLKDVDLDS